MPKQGEREPKYIVAASDIQKFCQLYTGGGGEVYPARESESVLYCGTPHIVKDVHVREEDGVAITRREGGIYPLTLQCDGCEFNLAWSGKLRKKVT